MNKSYIKSILLRMETIVIVMPIQRFSLKHHIMENWNKFPSRWLQQWLASVWRKLLFLWSEQAQLDRRTCIFYIHIFLTKHIYLYGGENALLYSVNIKYETLIKLHMHLRTGPGTHICIYVCVLYYFWGLYYNYIMIITFCLLFVHLCRGESKY